MLTVTNILQMRLRIIQKLRKFYKLMLLMYGILQKLRVCSKGDIEARQKKEKKCKATTTYYKKMRLLFSRGFIRNVDELCCERQWIRSIYTCAEWKIQSHICTCLPRLSSRTLFGAFFPHRVMKRCVSKVVTGVKLLL